MTEKFIQAPPGLPALDPIAAAHCRQVAAHLQDLIAQQGGTLGFSEFMEHALYAPGLGYYSAGAAKFGAQGDFVTAPELSALFSRCLARQAAQVLSELDGQGVILELGAGSGIMAADMLSELQQLNCLPQHYYILERSAELRQRQQHTLSQRLPIEVYARVVWLEQLPAAASIRGFIVANEVLDALPVERLHLLDQQPQRLAVSYQAEAQQFVWTTQAADAPLLQAWQTIRDSLPWSLSDGYRTEYCPSLDGWMAALSRVLAQGVILLIDYGYPRREFYHPERSDGTLLCHYRHHAHADPLCLPGLQDLTASVDFTAVADAGLAADLELLGYTTQAYFLLACGIQQFAEQATPSSREFFELVRQIKLLTLPSEMGERFQVIAFGRECYANLLGFSFDQRQRLG